VTLRYTYIYYQSYTEYYQYHEYYTMLYIIRYYAYAYMCCECGLFITLYSVVHTYINCHVVIVFVPHVLRSLWRERESE